MRNQKGQSLIEALIALGAAVVIVSAITIASITAMNNSDYSKYQNLATHYAEQGIEILRQNSQTSWNTFSGLAGVNPHHNTYCFGQDVTDVSHLQAIAVGDCDTPNIKNEKGTEFFVRQFSLINYITAQSLPNPTTDNFACNGIIRATVTVSWTDGKCTDTDNLYCHKVSFDSCFANVNQVPVP